MQLTLFSMVAQIELIQLIQLYAHALKSCLHKTIEKKNFSFNTRIICDNMPQ